MLNRLDFLDGDPISEEFQVLSTFILSAEPGFFIFYNCNSVYSKRTSDFGVPSKLAKLLDLIDLMKTVDSDKDRKMKNSRAEESQNFYKTF